MNETPTESEVLITAEQVAKILGVNKKTLRRMIEQGDFPAPTIYGKQSRWIKETVMEFIKAVALVQSVKRQREIPGQTGSIEGNSGTSLPDTQGASGKTKKSG